MDFLNSRATLVFLLAVIALAAVVYYSQPEHQSTGMGQALQRFSRNLQNPGQQPAAKTEDMGDKLRQMVE